MINEIEYRSGLKRFYERYPDYNGTHPRVIAFERKYEGIAWREKLEERISA